MKKVFFGLFICAGIAMAGCQSHRADQAAADSSLNAAGKMDSGNKMTDTTAVGGKPDTSGKSDGAGTGPSTGVKADATVKDTTKK